MSEIGAALLVGMLPELDDLNTVRALGLRHFLNELNPAFTAICDDHSLNDGAFYGLPIRLRDHTSSEIAIRKIVDEVGLLLENCYPAIPLSPLFPPQPEGKLFGLKSTIEDLPNATALPHSTVVVPHWAFLGSQSSLSGLAAALNALLGPQTVHTVKDSAIADLPTVAVVVLTRLTRSKHLSTCLESLNRQTYRGPIKVSLIVDDTNIIPELPVMRAEISLKTWAVPGWISAADSTFEHVARLRNLAILSVREPLVAFLDDDNEWLPEHLDSLVSALHATDAAAAHSWRLLIDDDGCSYTPTTFPWEADPAVAQSRYEAALCAGLFQIDSPIVRDEMLATTGEIQLGMVDLGEWLFRRELFDSVAFSTMYTSSDLNRSIGEDDKLLALLRDLDIPVKCTHKATLRYRLGGFSGGKSTT